MNQTEKDAIFENLLPTIMHQFHPDMSEQEGAERMEELRTIWRQSERKASRAQTLPSPNPLRSGRG